MKSVIIFPYIIAPLVNEAIALELPQQCYLAALATELFTSTWLSLEWAVDKDYSMAKGGSGDQAQRVTLQLAAEF